MPWELIDALAIGAEHVFVVMEHRTTSGESKLVQRCTCPLTGLGCGDRKS